MSGITIPCRNDSRLGGRCQLDTAALGSSYQRQREATDADSHPPIPSEIEPRIGPVPGRPTEIRILWGGGVCDTEYTVRIAGNDAGGMHFNVAQGALGNPGCDSLGIRRGVVITFASAVDAAPPSGAFQAAVLGT